MRTVFAATLGALAAAPLAGVAVGAGLAAYVVWAATTWAALLAADAIKPERRSP
jgi:hypothetical protein